MMKMTKTTEARRSFFSKTPPETKSNSHDHSFGGDVETHHDDDEYDEAEAAAIELEMELEDPEILAEAEASRAAAEENYATCDDQPGADPEQALDDSRAPMEASLLNHKRKSGIAAAAIPSYHALPVALPATTLRHDFAHARRSSGGSARPKPAAAGSSVSSRQPDLHIG